MDSALAEVVDAFMQLQFFDRVSQRMDHAVQSIDVLLDPIQALSKPMEMRFTMEDERDLYKALMDGSDVDGAVEAATNQLNNRLDKSDGDDIELF